MSNVEAGEIPLFERGLTQREIFDLTGWPVFDDRHMSTGREIPQDHLFASLATTRGGLRCADWPVFALSYLATHRTQRRITRTK